jgi:hypothetical protein
MYEAEISISEEDRQRFVNNPNEFLKDQIDRLQQQVYREGQYEKIV